MSFLRRRPKAVIVTHHGVRNTHYRSVEVRTIETSVDEIEICGEQFILLCEAFCASFEWLNVVMH
jgi:hypothetical protein